MLVKKYWELNVILRELSVEMSHFLESRLPGCRIQS